MLRSLLLILLGILIPNALPAQSVADPLQWTNPILPQRADPHVTLHSDGWYYFTATAPEYDCIELRRAKTVGGLASAEAKVIWRKHANGPMSHHIWAPEIHFISGKWYIYFAAGRAEAIWDIRQYVLENSSANPLEGTWTEKGEIKMNWDSFTLDATTFEHRGTRYLAWAQSIPDVRGTSLFLAKMDTPWSITGTQACISRPELPWERIGHNVNEAPAVIHRNGRLFMTYSASATDANYCLGLLTADENADLLNPKSWSKSQSPVFKSTPATSQYGPGHNCFTTTPDGKTDIMVYHARNYEHITGDPLGNPDRATRAQVLTWNTDGTPDFGVPVADDLRPVHRTGGNPIITKVFTADPAALVHQGRVYLYTGHDIAPDNNSSYRMNDWLLFSSTNMVDWEEHGSPLAARDFKWAKGDAWASQVIERDGKFYWYVAVEHGSVHGKAIGVAVADSPTGPFKDARGSALVVNDMTKATKISWDDIDPTAWIDDDGQAYLFWGNQKCYWAKLKANMTELDGEIHVIPDEQLNGFTEAPWIHKRNGIFYLTYATGFPEKISYATSSKITGPWTPRGLLTEIAGNSNTIHQSIIEFLGSWYFIYHNGGVQTTGGSFRRSVCIDYLYYNPDGTLKRVVQTSEGVNLPPTR
jgi:GH43 family beta-xylosidase